MRLDRLGNARCCGFLAVAVLLSVIATLPALEMGFNDDWSFAFTALRLAQTGRLTYNGWGQPFLGFQALWGAATIQLFGFSFTGLRLSTLPLAMGCAVIFFLLSRRSGLRTGMALFGALTFCLSPLFLPLAASFMTDVPSVFFVLLSLLAFTAAVQATSERGCIAWLAAAALAGIAAGTIRQIAYVAPLAVLPVVLVGSSRARSKRMILACTLLWIVTLVTWMGTARWQSRQPNLIPVDVTANVRGALAHPVRSIRNTISILQAAVLFILPVNVVYVGTRVGSCSKRRCLAALFLALLLMLGCRFVAHVPRLIGNIVTHEGVLDTGTELLGSKPPALPGPALGAALFLAYLTIAFVVLEAARGGLPPLTDMARTALLILLPFTAAYFSALLLFADGLCDRYILPLLPVAVIFCLLSCRSQVGPKILAAGSLCLSIAALYGVATTHDYLAAGRARAAAASCAEAAGVPRTSISAGLEYDAWTELMQSGHIGASPPVKRFRLPPPAAESENYWMWHLLPDLQPRYFVVYSSQPHLTTAPFPRFPYTAWLPPFHREVLVQMLPPARTANAQEDIR